MNLCKGYLSLLLNYPDLIGIILSGSTEGASAVLLERFEKSVSEFNLGRERLKDVFDLLVDYLHGFSYSAACNKTDIHLTANMADGPLNFIIENLNCNI